VASLALAAASSIGISAVQAATIAWTGGGADTNWSTTGNWQGGILPGAGDTVTFAGAGGHSSHVDVAFPSNGALGGVDVQSGGWTFSGGGFYLGAGGMSIAGTTSFSGPVVLNADQAWSADVLDLNLGVLDMNGHHLALTGTNLGGFRVTGLSSNGDIDLDGDLNLSGGGVSDYTGTITVLNRFLDLGQSMLGATVAVAGGEAAGFGGQVGPVSVTSGRLNIGNPGSLTMASLSMSSSSTFIFDPKGTCTAKADVLGGVALGSAHLDVSTASVVTTGTVCTMIRNETSTPISGIFLGHPEGHVFQDAAHSQWFQISYVGGAGNDVTLTSVDAPSVPTASTVATTVAPTTTDPGTTAPDSAPDTTAPSSSTTSAGSSDSATTTAPVAASTTAPLTAGPTVAPSTTGFSGGPLPRTGSSSAWLLVLASVFVLSGTLLVRRRHPV
jgi:LPXTG-motif cell wall-anchored protein